jgi:hypothetical protein
MQTTLVLKRSNAVTNWGGSSVWASIWCSRLLMYRKQSIILVVYILF